MIWRWQRLVLVAAIAFAPPSAAQKGDAKRITADDIAKHPDLRTAHEAIRKIRPNFFRLPPNNTVPTAAIGNVSGRIERSLFVDEIFQDRLDDLKQIPASDVEEIRLMSEEDVVLYFGKQGHVYGAIAVKTRRKAPSSQ